MTGGEQYQQAQIPAVAALDELSRRRLYDYMVRQSEPVSRDEAAAALELPPSTVAFHLDRPLPHPDAGIHRTRVRNEPAPARWAPRGPSSHRTDRPTGPHPANCCVRLSPVKRAS